VDSLAKPLRIGIALSHNASYGTRENCSRQLFEPLLSNITKHKFQDYFFLDYPTCGILIPIKAEYYFPK